MDGKDILAKINAALDGTGFHVAAVQREINEIDPVEDDRGQKWKAHKYTGNVAIILTNFRIPRRLGSVFASPDNDDSDERGEE